MLWTCERAGIHEVISGDALIFLRGEFERKKGYELIYRGGGKGMGSDSYFFRLLVLRKCWEITIKSQLFLQLFIKWTTTKGGYIRILRSDEKMFDTGIMQ